VYSPLNYSNISGKHFDRIPLILVYSYFLLIFLYISAKVDKKALTFHSTEILSFLFRPALTVSHISMISAEMYANLLRWVVSDMPLVQSACYEFASIAYEFSRD
jgi:hypothetical protein